MRRRIVLGGTIAAVAAGVAGWFGLRRLRPAPLPPAAFAAIYADPLPPPDGPMRVYHLGHSLVGRDMPAMLEQLAPPGHGHHSQLGWGATLKAHWGPAADIGGYDRENAHPRFRPAPEATDSGAYDAVVLTEMVEIRDALRYFDSPLWLARWAARARAANPAVRVYLYETWHRLDDPEGWLDRLDADLDRHWIGGVLRPALARQGVGGPIHLIPAGQAMARVVRTVEGGGAVPGLARREDLFAREESGAQDMIHFNDQGAYLVALVHYAVLYHRSPEGLPHALLRADGTPADAPSPEAAALMQRLVWDVVRTTPLTGVGDMAA